jgi:hypothetical protein
MATNIPDFTRYLKKEQGVYWQVPFLPLIQLVLGLFGIISTSASKVVYGQYVWDPLDLASHWDGPSGRAGAFFVGFCCKLPYQMFSLLLSQLIFNRGRRPNRYQPLCKRHLLLQRHDLPLPKIHQHPPRRNHHHRDRRLDHGSLENHPLRLLPTVFHGRSRHLPRAYRSYSRGRFLGRQEETY